MESSEIKTIVERGCNSQTLTRLYYPINNDLFEGKELNISEIYHFMREPTEEQRKRALNSLLETTFRASEWTSYFLAS